MGLFKVLAACVMQFACLVRCSFHFSHMRTKVLIYAVQSVMQTVCEVEYLRICKLRMLQSSTCGFTVDFMYTIIYTQSLEYSK